MNTLKTPRSAKIFLVYTLASLLVAIVCSSCYRPPNQKKQKVKARSYAPSYAPEPKIDPDKPTQFFRFRDGKVIRVSRLRELGDPKEQFIYQILWARGL